MATLLQFLPHDRVHHLPHFDSQPPGFVMPRMILHEMARWAESARQQGAEPEPKPRPTASSAELATIKRFRVGVDGCDEPESECAICLERIKKGEEAARLPCKHAFHSACVGAWLEHHDNRCPVCRQELAATQSASTAAQSGPDPSPAQRLGELSVRGLVHLCETRGLGQAARSCLEKRELVALLTAHARRQQHVREGGSQA